MKEVSTEIRKGVLTALGSLEIDGVVIPIFDSQVPTQAVIPTYKGGLAYIVLKDQQEVETTDNKCTFRQNASITLDVITKFPKGSGGNLNAETISKAIQYIIQPFNGIGISAGSDFQILRTTKSASQSLREETPTQSVYRKIIIYTFDTFEK
jgi:hypothetical protein